MKVRLIEDWRAELHRLWCIRISIAFAVFTGVSGVISAFVDVLNPWALVVLSVVVNLALVPLSRLVKQAEKSQ